MLSADFDPWFSPQEALFTNSTLEKFKKDPKTPLKFI
jgi:hypothetical protein